MAQPGAGKGFYPFGPCQVSWGTSTLNATTIYPVTVAATLTLLGTSNTADAVDITEEWKQYRPTVSDFGPNIPLPPYNMGEVHRLRIPLVYFDINQLIALKQAVRGDSSATDGVSGQIGGKLNVITLKFAATLPGSRNKIYPLCLIEESSLNIRGYQYGQDAVHMLTAVAFTNPSSPPAATDTIYTTIWN